MHDDHPPTLDYDTPQPDPPPPKPDVLTVVAFAIAALSMAVAATPDPGGARYFLQIRVGLLGGSLGVVVAATAKIHLLIKQTRNTSNLVAAALALTFSCLAILAALRLYSR
jgi:hypothetical protein